MLPGPCVFDYLCEAICLSLHLRLFPSSSLTLSLTLQPQWMGRRLNYLSVYKHKHIMQPESMCVCLFSIPFSLLCFSFLVCEEGSEYLVRNTFLHCEALCTQPKLFLTFFISRPKVVVLHVGEKNTNLSHSQFREANSVEGTSICWLCLWVSKPVHLNSQTEACQLIVPRGQHNIMSGLIPKFAFLEGFLILAAQKPKIKSPLNFKPYSKY